MGASQSSTGDDGGGDESQVKTSYYELLGIDRTATDDDIKKAYRKKALELHPDRNHGDVERTTALFAQVQSAYEVLSDRQERAWYDAHEGDILRGGAAGQGEAHYEHNMRVTTTEDVLAMLGRFSANVDFSDSPNGFYGFLRDTFDQLAREERHAADHQGVDVPDYPSFGHKDDDYPDVVRSFYAMWNGFATRKSFAWMDLYRLSEAPDRRVRRLMDKENKRLREAGIRDFNSAVRQLVLFVRKRDPRYTPNNPAKNMSTDEFEKAQRAKGQAQAARSRAMHAAKTHEAVPEWAQARESDKDDEDEEEESEVEEQVFECVACHKTFKSERQYEAHEKSKKHQKAMYTLKRQMQKDNANLNLDAYVEADHGVAAPASDPVEQDISDDIEKLKVEKEREDIDEDKDEDKDGDGDSKPHPPQEAAKKEAPRPATSSNDDDNDDDDDDDDDDDEYASRSDIEARLAAFRRPSTSTSTPAPTAASASASASTAAGPKLGAAAQKRAKKAAKLASQNESPAKFTCGNCQAEFGSKNQLFGHLGEFPTHAAPMQQAVNGGKGGKKGKRK